MRNYSSFYALMTCAFYSSVKNAYGHSGDIGDMKNRMIFILASGILGVWMCGWRDVKDAPCSANPDAAAKAANFTYQDGLDMYHSGMMEGLAMAGDGVMDPELAHKAALQYTLGRIYDAGYAAAKRAVECSS